MEFWIDNQWTPSSGSERIEVRNPATGALLETVPLGNAEDADRAIRSAATAFKSWRKTSVLERVNLQRRAAALMRSRADELALSLTLELGRPLAAAKTEIERSAELLEVYAEEALRLRDEILPSAAGSRTLVVRQPIGVVIAIAPFNYPITLLTFKLGAALVAGCTVVAKPAEDTPITTLKLAELFLEAGFPAGVFNVVTGGAALGAALVGHPIPRKVAFTGSSTTGIKIAQLAMQTLKSVTLELGGQCPALVLEDADVERAASAIARHSFSNSGQFCYRVNRVYVHQTIYQKFLERLEHFVSQIKVGDPLEAGCTMGPMIDVRIARVSESHIQDAIEHGANMLTGGLRLTGGMFDAGIFLPPTVLSDTSHAMKIMTEETFGPVLGVMPFDELETAIDLANDSVYGLAAFVFTKDQTLGWRIAEELEAGSVWVNDIQRSSQLAPFGGVKQSGLGREKGRYGLEDYLELKTVYLS
jgi:succinate-semialdehyde dehydrogenase / glutarate-semialdehyde dehydrogenase